MANPLKLLDLQPNGFQFIEELPIQATPSKVWSSLQKVDQWFRFDPDPKKASKHTFEATAGSRWISENWEGNTVFHGMVTYVEPGKLLRLEGQIGATHLPVITVAIFELQPQEGDKTTLLRLGQRTFGLIDADLKTRATNMWKRLLPQLKELAEK